MERACLKCGRANTAASGNALEECPGCGAIYSRVEKQRQKQSANTNPSARLSSTNVKALIAIALFTALIAIGRFNRDPSPATQNSSAPPSAIDTAGKPPLPAGQQMCAEDDANCIGAREKSKAEPACRAAVENHLAYRSEWKDGMFEDKFERVAWYEPTTTLIYSGDKLEAQNGFGAWAKVNYFCVWGIDGQAVQKAGISPK